MYDTYSLLFSSQNRFYEESNEKTHLLETDWKQLNLVEQNLDTQDSLIAEREEGIDEIHGKMVEVNEIFTDLNTIVVEKGVVELEKATNYQRKANSKTRYIVCLLFI